MVSGCIEYTSNRAYVEPKYLITVQPVCYQVSSSTHLIERTSNPNTQYYRVQPTWHQVASRRGRTQIPITTEYNQHGIRLYRVHIASSGRRPQIPNNSITNMTLGDIEYKYLLTFLLMRTDYTGCKSNYNIIYIYLAIIGYFMEIWGAFPGPTYSIVIWFTYIHINKTYI
jgi:hypothetical protein